jgi:hypothetical protein
MLESAAFENSECTKAEDIQTKQEAGLKSKKFANRRQIFPKDTQQLVKLASKSDVQLELLSHEPLKVRNFSSPTHPHHKLLEPSTGIDRARHNTETRLTAYQQRETGLRDF